MKQTMTQITFHIEPNPHAAAVLSRVQCVKCPSGLCEGQTFYDAANEIPLKYNYQRLKIIYNEAASFLQCFIRFQNNGKSTHAQRAFRSAAPTGSFPPF